MNRTRGFTLIELAIVLVIITILVGGLTVPLSAQIQARRVAETKKTLDEAREALYGYAMTHAVLVDHDANPLTADVVRPYLPCPDSDGDGVENRDSGGTCTQYAGWFPWVTLATAAQDAWGNRLHYAAKPEVTRATSGFHNGSAGAWYEVCSSDACAAPDVAAGVPVVLLSHGPNGWGARNVGGSMLAAPTGPDELENLDADDRYVSRVPSAADAASGEFDDLVSWLAFNAIVSRVCPAGGCP